MQAPARPIPEVPLGATGPYDADGRIARGGCTHGGRRSEHRSAALRGTRVRAARGVPLPCARPGPDGLRPFGGRSRGVLGGTGRSAGLGQALGHGHELDPSVGPVVRGRAAQRLVQLPRPPRRGGRRRQGRVLLGGRAGGGTGDHLSGAARGGLSLRERPQVARGAEGRSGRDLPWHGPRAASRHARVRPDRRPALGGVRWLLLGVVARSHQRCGGQAPGDLRRGLPSRLGGAPQGQRGRGPQGMPDDRARDHRAADREGAPVHRGTRRVVPRAHRGPAAGVRARADGLGGSVVPAVHERHDREAEGHRPHDGRVPHPGRGDPSG